MTSPASHRPASLALEERLCARLSRLSYQGLTACSAELFQRLGCRDTVVLRTRRHQRTQSGGYDLRALLRSELTATPALIQLKQYTRPVSRRFVDELRGAMLRVGAGHGILVTLSSFSRVARRASAGGVAPIRLIEGREFARLMVEHGIGVLKGRRGGRLDELYFANLDERFPPKPTGRPGPPERATPANQGVMRRREGGGEVVFRTHALLAVSSLWLLEVVPPGIERPMVGTLAALAVFGAMRPDLDAPASQIRSLRIGGVQPFDPLGYAANALLGHRGILHSAYGLLGCLALGAALAPWWGWQASAALCLGYLSHLLADACTRAGIPLLP